MFKPGANLTSPGLLAIAADAGLEPDVFQRCLSTDGERRVAESVAIASKLGVNMTPSFVIGRVVDRSRVKALRVITGAADYETIAAAVKEVRASSD